MQLVNIRPPKGEEPPLLQGWRTYLPPLPPDLANEFAAWDAASDDAWLTFGHEIAIGAGEP